MASRRIIPCVFYHNHLKKWIKGHVIDVSKNSVYVVEYTDETAIGVLEEELPRNKVYLQGE